MYGTQTSLNESHCRGRFENDVKMYGTQTKTTLVATCGTFENDVKMYGTQTLINMNLRLLSLRMM